jgi:hypothetical protein
MIDSLLFAAAWEQLPRSAYALPLIVAISLVWSASRYEKRELILGRAARLSLQITGFMIAVMAVFAFFGWGL